MSPTGFPYTRDDILRRTENLALLFMAARGVKGGLAKTKNIEKITKNPNLLKLGAALMILPEPVTTALGIPLVAYALSEKNSLRLGEELARSYMDLWKSLSCL